MHTNTSTVCLFAASAWLLSVSAGCGQSSAQSAKTASADTAITLADVSKLPAFLKVDNVYIFDGSEDDLVKVLELDGNHGWARVQTKAGESWVNIANVTTITPVSKEEAAKSEMKAKADAIRDGAIALSAAVDAYATQNNLGAEAPYKWDDIRKQFKTSNPTLYSSGGKDMTGRPYLFGPKVSDHVKISADTIREFTPVIDDPDTYWGKFKP